MGSILEKALVWLLLGSWPPVPNELRSDYAKASEDEQAKMRLHYAVRHLRVARITAIAIGILAVKWAWEYGALAFLGLGSGVALAGDVDSIRNEVSQSVVAQQQFQQEYRRDHINTRIQQIDAEVFQIDLALSTAQRQGREADPLHVKRKSDLTKERDALQKSLDAMLAAMEAAAVANNQQPGKKP